MGDSWIAPVDFTQAWLPYLEALSLLDGQPLVELQRLADSAKVPVAAMPPAIVCLLCGTFFFRE